MPLERRRAAPVLCRARTPEVIAVLQPEHVSRSVSPAGRGGGAAAAQRRRRLAVELWKVGPPP